MTRPGLGAYALLVALALIWGGSFLFIKIGVATIPPLTLTAVRLVIGALVLVIVARMSGQLLPRGRRLWWAIALVAFFGNALPFTLISWGEEVIDSGVASILMAVMPLVTLVCAHFATSDEKMNSRKLLGVVFGLAGLVVLIGPEKLSQLGDNTVRQLAVAAAAACYAIHALLIRRIKGVPHRALAAAVMIASVPMILPAALVFEQPWQLQPSTASIWAAITLGVFHTALATLLMFAIVTRSGATFFSQINFLIPLIGVAYGVMFLAERPPPSAYLALGLILTGIYIVRSGGMGSIATDPPTSKVHD